MTIKHESSSPQGDGWGKLHATGIIAGVVSGVILIVATNYYNVAHEVNSHYRAGNDAMDHSEPEKAIACFTEAYRHSGSFDPAAKWLDGIVVPSDQILYARATAYFEKKAFWKAATDLDQAVALKGKNADYWILRADACRELRSFDSALTSLQLAESCPVAGRSLKDCRSKLACAVAEDAKSYLKSGDHREWEENLQLAIAQFSRAISIDPVQPRLFIERARLLSYLRQYEDSLKDLDEAIRLAPKDPDSYLAKADHFARVYPYDPEKVIEWASKAVSVEVGNYRLYVQRAEYFANAKSFSLAVKDMDKAFELDPERTNLGTRAQYLFECRQYDRCIADLRSCIEWTDEQKLDRSIASYKAHLLRRLSACYRKKQMFEKAIEDLTEANRLIQDNIFLLDRAQAHWEKKDRAAAISDSLDFVRHASPKKGDFYRQRFWHWTWDLLSTENRSNRIYVAKHAIEANQTDFDDPYCLLSLACIKADKQEFDEAVALQKNVLEMRTLDAVRAIEASVVDPKVALERYGNRRPLRNED